MAFSSDVLWRTVDGMLAQANVAGILAHQLAPLAAYRLRRLGQAVPDAFLPEEQIARTAVMTSIPLLRRAAPVLVRTRRNAWHAP